jgi:hypothetical protein
MIRLNSPDGLAALQIASETKVLTKDDKPLEYIVMQQSSEPSNPAPDARIIGLAYNMLPEGAKFDPPVELAINYDPASLPQGAAEGNLSIAHYDTRSGWLKLESTVDTVNHTVKAKITHFSKYTILYGAEADGQNGASSGSSSPPAKISWTLVTVIFIAVISLMLRFVYFPTRKKSDERQK